MTERSILITGCSSGIGAHSARALKQAGWRVFATARTHEDIATLERDGLDAFHLDYRDPTSIAACADAVLKCTGGKLYALFNNGAYGQPGAIEDLPVERLRDQFEANVIGWHDLTRRLIPAMRANGGGRIVQNSSVLGLVSVRYRGAYCASKFAVEALSDSLRMELKGSGIHVSLIEPGPIATRFAVNAAKALKAHIDMKNSVHAEIYRARVEELDKGGRQAFKLGPEAVHAKLVHALESAKPKARYYVTVPTYGAGVLRRLLPTGLLDRVVSSW